MLSAARLDAGHQLSSWSHVREHRCRLWAGPASLVQPHILNCEHEVMGGENLLIQVKRLSSCQKELAWKVPGWAGDPAFHALSLKTLCSLAANESGDIYNAKANLQKSNHKAPNSQQRTTFSPGFSYSLLWNEAPTQAVSGPMQISRGL